MKKVIIVHDYAEDIGPGSSPTEDTFIFTSQKLANEFISDWEIFQQNQMKTFSFYEKDDEQEHKYFGAKDWVYWLEIKKVKVNKNPYKNLIK